ncbi:reverse transcriptase domain-containing protein [Tanacetum coccineum]
MKTPTPIPNQGDCHQKPKKTSNFVEKKRANTVISIEENRQEVELIDLPPHLDTHSWKMKTCTVIIAKELSFGEKRSDQATILIAPNWDLPFELMCDASDYAIGAVLGQRHEKHFQPIHYASKTMIEAESNYTTTEKEMLAVVLLKAIIALMGSPPPRICLYVLDTKEARTSPGRSSCPDLEITRHAEIWSHSPSLHRISPTTSGQVEVSNRGLKRILERTIGENRASWSGQIDDALWAFRTAYLIAHRVYSLQACESSTSMELNELVIMPLRILIYKEKKENPWTPKIKNRVFKSVIESSSLFKLKIFSGKLKFRWSGTISPSHNVFPYGHVVLSLFFKAQVANFKVNGSSC